MKKKTTLRTIREQAHFSIFKLSKLSGVSFEKVRQLDMGYRVEGTRLEIKEKIAYILRRNVWDVFPDVKKAMIQRMDAKSRSQRLLLVVKDYLPDLRLTEEEEVVWENTLGLMGQDEVGLDIIHSGQDVATCKRNMRKYIKKYKTDRGAYPLK